MPWLLLWTKDGSTFFLPPPLRGRLAQPCGCLATEYGERDSVPGLDPAFQRTGSVCFLPLGMLPLRGGCHAQRIKACAATPVHSPSGAVYQQRHCQPWERSSGTSHPGEPWMTQPQLTSRGTEDLPRWIQSIHRIMSQSSVRPLSSGEECYSAECHRNNHKDIRDFLKYLIESDPTPKEHYLTKTPQTLMGESSRSTFARYAPILLRIHWRFCSVNYISKLPGRPTHRKRSRLLLVTKMCHPRDPSPYAPAVVFSGFQFLSKWNSGPNFRGDSSVCVRRGLAALQGFACPRVSHALWVWREQRQRQIHPGVLHRTYQGAWSMAGTQEPFVEWNAARSHPSVSNKNVLRPWQHPWAMCIVTTSKVTTLTCKSQSICTKSGGLSTESGPQCYPNCDKWKDRRLRSEPQREAPFHWGKEIPNCEEDRSLVTKDISHRCHGIRAGLLSDVHTCVFRTSMEASFTWSLIFPHILQGRHYYSHSIAADIDPVSSWAISMISDHQAVRWRDAGGRVMDVSGSAGEKQ